MIGRVALFGITTFGVLVAYAAATIYVVGSYQPHFGRSGSLSLAVTLAFLAAVLAAVAFGGGVRLFRSDPPAWFTAVGGVFVAAAVLVFAAAFRAASVEVQGVVCALVIVVSASNSAAAFRGKRGASA